MKPRRRYTMIALLPLVLGQECVLQPAPSPSPSPPPGDTWLDEWTPGADVPDDPNRPGEKVAWSIEPSTGELNADPVSAAFYLDGRQDDGTIWLMRAFSATPDSQVTVDLSFDLWSESESFNIIIHPAAFAGPNPPQVEEDFDTSQDGNLVAGWRTYDYSFETSASETGEVWVAFGISVVWETEVLYYIDNVQVNIE